MKRIIVFCVTFFLAFTPVVLAGHADLVLLPTNIRFSITTFLEGKEVRIYATTLNTGSADLRGVVRFFDEGKQIQGDQPISVVAGKEDSVFVDWVPVPGERKINIVVVPFEHEDKNSANNAVIKSVTVLADTDRDGIPNRDDPDDDNDKVTDAEDAFPLNKNEWLDSDGDTIGNNKDDDDDNDGVPDTKDEVPLNASETLDTDRDGIGNNEDSDDDGDSIVDTEETKQGSDPLKIDTDGDTVNDREDAYPTDPTQARDYDRDGIGDERDPDADNDGIPKENDTNDTNLGPEVIITTNGRSPPRFAFPNEEVLLETEGSRDPDGRVSGVKWELPESPGSAFTTSTLSTRFPTVGFHTVKVTLTDDKGETREATKKLLVIPLALPWIGIGLLLLATIIAIFFLFSYTGRRASRWERVYAALDTILRILPEPKSKKKRK